MSENTSSGPSWANTMRPTKLAESVSSKANAPSTAFCIHEPTLEPKAPQYRRRNVGYRRAARAVPGADRAVVVDQRVLGVSGSEAGFGHREGRR